MPDGLPVGIVILQPLFWTIVQQMIFGSGLSTPARLRGSGRHRKPKLQWVIRLPARSLQQLIYNFYVARRWHADEVSLEDFWILTMALLFQ